MAISWETAPSPGASKELAPLHPPSPAGSFRSALKPERDFLGALMAVAWAGTSGKASGGSHCAGCLRVGVRACGKRGTPGQLCGGFPAAWRPAPFGNSESSSGPVKDELL